MVLRAKRRLKDSEARQVFREFVDRYPLSEQKLKSAKEFEELIVEGGGAVVFVDGRPLILRTKEVLLPSLKFDELVGSLPKVVVDMGAVPHVVNGAKVMRPGIRQLSSAFAKGDLVAIADEKFGKVIALGVAEMDSEAMKSIEKGKAVANVHYVGDMFWAAFGAPK
jgi:PUA-domain protein